MSLNFRKFFQKAAAVTAVFCMIILSVTAYYSAKLPQVFYVYEGKELILDNITVNKKNTNSSYEKTNLASSLTGTDHNVSLRLFGLIPIKSTHVKVVDEKTVSPGGAAFGIKLFTKGVIVVETSSIDTSNGSICPAALAGICKGDVVLTIDKKEVSTNEEVAKIISNSNGKTVTVKLVRDNKEINVSLKPVLSKIDNTYKGGLWVRDSSAGIGTITYYDTENSTFAGLGHAICDSDTGKIMPLSTGEICNVNINSVLKGQVGSPGELRGSFASDKANGKLLLNNEAGIFGTIDTIPQTISKIPVMLKQEIKKGKATILCTLDQSGPKEYEINIDKIDLNPNTLTKNMMITVTDEELIKKTGGIVQGMSGSPILQNGKLVGAVTHVFVNDPTKGYGIFAEHMISFSNILEYVE